MKTFRIRDQVYQAGSVILIGLTEPDKNEVIVLLDNGRRECVACKDRAAALKLVCTLQDQWVQALAVKCVFYIRKDLYRSYFVSRISIARDGTLAVAFESEHCTDEEYTCVNKREARKELARITSQWEASFLGGGK